MSNHSNNSKHTPFVEGPLRSLMAPLVLLWSSFSVPFRLLKSVALPSTYLRRTFDVPSTKRLLRVAVMGVMMICCIPTMAQIVPTTDTDGNGTIEDSEKKLYLIQANKFASFYMVAKGNDVNTANLPHSDMLWYFLEAENDSGTQYYYIVNNSTGKYICNTDYSSKGRTIGLLTFDSSSTDKFKFKLVDKTGGFYNISIKPNGGSWICLNKQGGNVGTNAVRLTDNAYINDGNSKWKFIAFDDSFSWPDPPFTLSPGESKTYYKIHNKQETSYYVSTGSGSPKYVTFSSTVSDDMAWYFVEAPTDNTGMKVRYYYIINPEAEDQYMYFRGNTGTSNQSDAVEVKAKSGENEDRYQFFVVLAARTTGGSAETPVECYMIVPKLLIGNLWNSNSFGSTSISEGSNMGIISGRANDSKAHWTFEETAYTPHCATPVITFDYTTSMVSISSATPGSTIYYTTSGDTPSTSSSEYSGPFSVTTTTTVKAIATHAGYYDSEIATLLITQVATPTIQDNGSNAISITSATEGATIYYTTDGSTPTTSSTVYTVPLTENVSNVTIKAIAVKENMITSGVGSGSVMLQCATPVITRVGLTFTLSCSMPTDASLYYTLEGGSETTYEGPVSFTTDQLPLTVTAVARHNDYTQSETATLVLTNGTGTPSDPYLIYSNSDFANFVANVNSGTTASACYKLGIDVSASGSDAITTTFTGTFDGDSHTISDLSNPLFNTVDGGVVKNVMLKGVAISSAADTVGAITNIATGYSRIYNCGILPNSADFPDGDHPYVRTTGNCAGGLVGSLRNDSRVVNCFSYADVQASNLAAGIVGRNTFASDASETDGKYANLRTMVVNCMFYGNITGGTNQYGVYGGQLITNAAATGINSYNYYSNGSTFTTTSGEPTAYNCSFPAEIRYLTQVEFHRSLLNSNRELCGWWVRSDVAPSTLTTAEVQAISKDASLMAKWVLDPNIAPYPILKPFGKYPSVINPFTGTPWFDHTQAEPYEGKQLGTLTVHVQSGDHSTASEQILSIPITDMDTLHYDYCYRKVQLPYFNTVFGNPNGATWAEKYAGNYTEYVVTGWKILGVDHEGANPFEAHWEHGYNFADRKCTAKDIYSENNKRVFAQGGNYYVPDGVTEITIEAYWGKAIYVRNNSASYDRVNITLGTTGSDFAPTGTRGNNVNGATIQTTSIKGTLTNANIDAKKTVYDYALVLVGNVQESVSNSDVVHAKDATRGFTIMSVDLDFDEEPDYCLEWQLGKNMARQVISPVRFDFLPIVELGIAGKLHNSTNFFSLGCFRSKGHFEVTETAFIRFGQFEFELGTRDDGPIILNGGIYDQYCRGRNGETNQHINYVIVGGHIVMPSFTPGAHVNSSTPYQTRHCAVNALGGNFTSFYLTGGYNEGVTPYVDNPHCYIDGGHFGTIAAAYKEGIAGNVTWRINHALIGEFYGGGVMAQATGDNYKIVKGSIDVVIDNSIVRKYCGGPKFGDMVTGKTVTTSATGTVFTQYFGAGNGGTNYTQYASTDDSQHGPLSPSTWANTVTTNYHVGQYRSADHSYEADYDIEVINTSTGDLEGRVINRSYYYAAQFATTNTGNVSNTLTGCTVLNNFYGAGFLGGVNGTVTSILNSDTILGSVYGAGYSASAGTVTVYNKDKTPPSANVYTGMIKPQSGGTSSTYYWSHNHGSTGSPATAASPATHDTAYFYTEISLENLGAVSNNVTLVITGNSTIGTVEGGNLVENTGNVFGGGDQSAVTGNTTVYLQDNTQVLGNVYGGGNNGSVNGDSEVVIQDIPVISGTTPFTESTTVTIAGPAGASLYYTIDGSTPTASSTAYTGSISLDNTTTVKAIAITNGVSSPVVTKTFTKQP